MKKIIYLLMSLSFAALVSCDDNDKTSSSNSSEISAEDMKKMAGKTLVIKTKKAPELVKMFIMNMLLMSMFMIITEG